MTLYLHQNKQETEIEVSHMFNKFYVVLIFLLFIGFSVALLGNESTSKYFPSTLDSYWVYEGIRMETSSHVVR